jgi:hypothetical protein
MIDVETLSRLKAMRLSGMAEYFENLAGATGAGRPTGPEMVKMAVAIIDRITTNAHATVLNCDDSMRKHFNPID